MLRAAALPAALIACGAVLVGCGPGSGAGDPSVDGVPLAAHTRLLAGVRRCNRGAHPFCARELVLVATDGSRSYANSSALRRAEQVTLRDAGWSISEGDTDEESAAESPGHRLRLTYATAAQDLRSVDVGHIDRAPQIAHELSARMFARVPALSLMVQAGSS